MRKKLPLSLAVLLTLGIVTLLIVPLWVETHPANVTSVTQHRVRHQPHPKETPTPTATRPELTPSPVVTATPHPTVTAPIIPPDPTVTAIPTLPPNTATLFYRSLTGRTWLYYDSPLELIGTEFAPGEPIHLIWEYQQPQPYNLGTIIAASDGSFDDVATAPSDLHQISQVNIVAIGTLSKKFALLSEQVTPDLIPNPYSAPAGGVVNIAGGGFDSGERVTVYLDGKVIGIGITDKRGAFSINYTVPALTPNGQKSLQASGQSSGIKVSADWFSTW